MILAVFELVDTALGWLESFSASPWFYLVIFVIALLDSVIPVVPSETTVILGGIAAGQDELSIALVIVLGALGAYVGDSIAYFLGRRAGPLATRWFFRGEKGEDRLRRTGNQIRKRGGLLLITARFIPGGRTALTFSCGLTRQPFFAWFTRWDMLAVTVWASYAGLLGFFFGDTFEDDHSTAFWWAFGTALSVSVVIEIVRWVRSRLSPPDLDVLQPEAEPEPDPVEAAPEPAVGASEPEPVAVIEPVAASEQGADGPQIGEGRPEQG